MFREAKHASTQFCRLTGHVCRGASFFWEKNFFQRYLLFNEKIFDFMLKMQQKRVFLELFGVPFGSGIFFRNFRSSHSSENLDLSVECD